jgi:crotonobetainyl-CoA:carnitine CoA-transferase CaiB-like acyl-CoA transferase
VARVEQPVGTSDHPILPLTGIHVLRAGDGYASRFAGRLLADLGATVIRPARADETHSPAEVLSRHLLAGTHARSRASEPAHVDVTIADQQIDPAEYARVSDAVVSVTPFGRTGPKRDYRATELVLFHAGGLGFVTPRPDQSVLPADFDGVSRPLYCAADLVGSYTGLHTAAASLASILGGLRNGRGYHVDLSQQEATLPLLRRELAVFRYTGRVAGRQEGGWRVAPAGIRPAKDGYLRITIIEDAQWRSFARLIGRDDWLDDRYGTADGRREHAEEIRVGIDAWLATTSVEDAFAACQEAGVAMAPVWSPAELTRLPALHSSGLLAGVNQGTDTLRINSALVLDGRRVRHSTRETGAEGLPRAVRTPLPPAGPADPAALAGIRVLDFGHVWAGPYGAQLLAHAGAEVIKIESNQRLDVHRRMQPYAGGTPDPNAAGVFNAQNSAKRSITLNLSTERGKEIARELIRLSDVGIQNFSLGVMERLGLGWEVIRALNPRFVYAVISAFGETGPYCRYKSYGPTIEACGGIAALTGYPGGGPRSMGGGIPDTASSVYGVLGILAALIRRERTGLGAKVSINQMDATVSLLPGPLLSGPAGGRIDQLIGNAHPTMAPHGVYAGREPDSWIAIACEDDTQWRAICEVLGGDVMGVTGSNDRRSDLAALGSAERLARREELDLVIERCTRTWRADRLEQALQRRGVPCTVCLSVADLMDDEHLASRNAFAEVTQAAAGLERIYRSSWTFARDPFEAPGPAPLLGADNEYVYGDVLGLSAAEIGRLTEEKVNY